MADHTMDFVRMAQEPLCEELRPFVHYSDEFGEGVYHPLVHQPFAMIPGMANRLYRQKVAALNEARDLKNWHAFVFIHERPYRAGALKQLRVLDGGPDAALWAQLCADVWVDSENIPQERAFWAEAFETTYGFDWMTEQEQAEFDALPDQVWVYRGECNDGGVSWTRSFDTARFFAVRGTNESEGVVTRGVVHKRDVFAYLTRRSETEVLVTDRSLVKCQAEHWRQAE